MEKVVFATGLGSFNQTWYCADCNMVKWPLVHSGGGVKVVVRAGVSKNGPGAVWVEEETSVLVGVVDRATMVGRPRIRQLLNSGPDEEEEDDVRKAQAGRQILCICGQEVARERSDGGTIPPLKVAPLPQSAPPLPHPQMPLCTALALIFLVDEF